MVRFSGQDFDIDAERVSAMYHVPREDLLALLEMPRLRALNLNTADIADDHLEIVGRLSTLEDLDISTTHVTDAGVRHLSGLTRMRHLRIKETRITDVGLGLLAPMRELETINIRRLDVTDAGLLSLAEHERLEMLVLSAGGRYTAAGLAEVQRRRPGCEIAVVH
jgi:hypothetical protein